ncbi:LLM class flavin-dependent oxidoreductase [Saccharothrix algeriensis]|uniref:Alkanesulfonate monooxygenase SsuD/methylene tetrahydromethanopterin reductase-like flavin-dependent oxidoreductase (Luciferase family) n=1 Tax=Saccharothrix algeriensis TaxID=173560 RepID=A0A8T8HWQ7_9PSEU|nr:LLM class flavin-dependent oxidoreductase [Saccharothrix algeriensis]MBM7814743.1 alkanesulfonate monooxygenase SsuD/methylene tetrahydromethanopterin reductase-like flavin-dependent oxidoreductase (luciferase family) [Saccharothrix algeriensis]QTR03025.1 LLM class flavin-dependent oxidoreductase [Saccharothrix algeriensis]
MDARFGLLLSARRDDGQSDADVLGRTVSLARQADALGLDDVWVTEHHFLDRVVSPSALALAAYLLGATRRVTVGTAVTLLPLHSPAHVAEQAALLDHVSGGRFALGVGRGQPLAEYEVIGRGADRWRAGMPGAVRELLAALRGEPVAEDLVITPGPRAAGGPDVLVAANSEDSVRLAAAHGLPMLLYFDKDTAAKREMIAEYRRAGGPADADHAFAAFVAVTGTEAEARALMRDRARTVVGADNRPRHLVPVSRTPPTGAALEAVLDTVTERLLGSHPVGALDTCVERLAGEIAASGCTRVLCQVESPGGTADAQRQLRLLAQAVVPGVRSALAAAQAPPKPVLR